MNRKKEYSKFMGFLGIIFIIFSGVFYNYYSDTSMIFYIFLSLGVISIIAYIVFNFHNIINALTKKKGIRKALTSILTIIIVSSILITLYFILKAYPKQIDLTQEKIYTLSEQSINLLKQVKSPIIIKIMSTKTQFDSRNGETANLLKTYTAENSNIKIVYLDSLKNPRIFKKYNIPLTGEGLGAMVIEKPNKAKYVTILAADLYKKGAFNPRTRRPKIEYQGESKLTSAIYTINEGKQPIIYSTTGHGEHSFNSPKGDGYNKIKNAIELENYIIKDINILTSDIPKDSKVLIISRPTHPFYEAEIKKISSYLKQGGNLFILIDPKLQNVNHGLDSLLSEWNIKISSAVVLDSKEAIVPDLFGRFFYHVGQYGSHKIVNLLKEKRLPILFLYSAPLLYGKPPADTIITPILQTTDKGWGEKGNNESETGQFDEGKDLKGPITFGLTIVKKLDKKTENRVVIIGDSDFVKNNATSFETGRDLFINSVNWLAKQEKKITIRPKERKQRAIVLTEQNKGLVFYFSILIIPFSIVVIGAIVYFIRKGKS